MLVGVNAAWNIFWWVFLVCNPLPSVCRLHNTALEYVYLRCYTAPLFVPTTLSICHCDGRYLPCHTAPLLILATLYICHCLTRFMLCTTFSCNFGRNVDHFVIRYKIYIYNNHDNSHDICLDTLLIWSCCLSSPWLPF